MDFKKLSFKDLQVKIDEDTKKIQILNDKIPPYDTEFFWGGIFDESPDNIYYDDVEEKWARKINDTEELMREKESELKELMESLELMKGEKHQEKLFKFKVGKILGYNQVNDLFLVKNQNGENVKKLLQTDEGRRYQYKIAQEVERNNLRAYLKPKPAKYKICVEAYVDYAQKDVDGLKAFVDCLVRALGNGDRKTFDDSQFWDVEIYKNKASHKVKNNEFFIVEFIEVNEKVMEQKNLYSRYVAQKAKNIRNEYKKSNK